MTPEEKQLNLIGVIRLSTKEQAEDGKEGIGRQIDSIEKIRQETGANIVRTIEVIESGSHTYDNAEFQKVFGEMAQPGIDGVAVAHVDRLVRSDRARDFSVFDSFQEYGKKIYVPGRVIDPSSQSGWMESIFLGMFGGIEKKLFKERTMGAKERNRRKGLCAVGWTSIPDGVLFDKATGKWSYDLDPNADPKFKGKRRGSKPGYALLVREAFERIAMDNISSRAAARMLGKSYSGLAVRRFFANRIWLGYRHYHEQAGGAEITAKSGRYRKRFKMPKPWEIRVIEEPLVSEELFNRVQEILARRCKEWGARFPDQRYPFLLAGLLRCSCGKPFYTRVRRNQTGKRYMFYYCASEHYRVADSCGMGTLASAAIESVVTNELMAQLLTEPVIDSIVGSNRQARHDDNSASRTRELAKIKRAEGDLADALRTQHLTLQEFRQQKEKLRMDRFAINVRYPESVTASWDDPTVLRDMLATVFAQLPFLEYQDRYDQLHRAVRRIMISGREIVSLTLSGGFLDEFMVKACLSKVGTRSPTIPHFGTTPDLLITLPKPIDISGCLGYAA